MEEQAISSQGQLVGVAGRLGADLAHGREVPGDHGSGGSGLLEAPNTSKGGSMTFVAKHPFDVSHPDALGALSRPMAPLVNAVNSLPVARWAMEKTLGGAAKKRLP